MKRWTIFILLVRCPFSLYALKIFILCVNFSTYELTFSLYALTDTPIEAEPEDIKLYRQYLVQSEYANSTIATKLNIVRIFYKAAQAHGLISNNPAAKVKAPKDRKDPATKITFMEAEELKFLLDHIRSELSRAKTNKQKLILLRDRALVGIMSLEGCRTVEMHQLRLCIAAEQFWSVRKIKVLKPLLIKDFDLEDKINMRSLMKKMSSFCALSHFYLKLRQFFLKLLLNSHYRHLENYCPIIESGTVNI